MTIARRLVLLLAVPLAALAGLGFFVRSQIAKVETLTRLVAEVQIESLGALGNISRRAAEMRISIRSYLLAEDRTAQIRYEADLRKSQAELTDLLARYGDELISSEKDRRLYTEYRELMREWGRERETAISLFSAGQRQEAAALVLSGRAASLGSRSNDVLGEWIHHNQSL